MEVDAAFVYRPQANPWYTMGRIQKSNYQPITIQVEHELPSQDISTTVMDAINKYGANPELFNEYEPTDIVSLSMDVPSVIVDEQRYIHRNDRYTKRKTRLAEQQKVGEAPELYLSAFGNRKKDLFARINQRLQSTTKVGFTDKDCHPLGIVMCEQVSNGDDFSVKVFDSFLVSQWENETALLEYAENSTFRAHVPQSIFKHGFMHNFVLFLNGDVCIENY